MPAQDRTAYPRFPGEFTERELRDLFTPAAEEWQFLDAATTAEPELRLNLALLLKTFQYLGYFPAIETIPDAVVTHMRAALRFASPIPPGYTTRRTLYRHHAAVRTFLQVKAYDALAQQLVTETVAQAAHVMDDPADLVNAAIEILVHEHYELPAFSRLDRMVDHLRTEVNDSFYRIVAERLTPGDLERLGKLLKAGEDHQPSEWNQLKQPPGRPSVSHMRALQARLTRLMSLISTADLREGLPATKVAHFAAEAETLDANRLEELAFNKRYTLLVCLLHQTQVKARDDLVEMFLRRMGRIHARGKEALAEWRQRQQETTDILIDTLARIVERTDEVPDDAELGAQVREILVQRGGIDTLREECERIWAYRGNNYLPLLYQFYRSHRSLLFTLARLLAVQSTTHDQSLIEALRFVQGHQKQTREWLPGELKLEFTTQVWQRLIVGELRGKPALNRRHLEVCVFSSLADELKSGDVYVPGSQDYADTRDQLLPWEVCEPMLVDYCGQIGIELTAEESVQQLRETLDNAARAADLAYPDQGQLVQRPDGGWSLRRLTRQKSPPGAVALNQALTERMPERHVLDILRHVQEWTAWSRHWGPFSGGDAKLDHPLATYLITAFGYGCNLGPWQMARHSGGLVTPRMLSFVNRQHVTVPKLEASLRDIINQYARFHLPWLWGTGKVASADGTHIPMAENTLLAQRHIRYGAYGGIAYRHVSDTYIALFSHFIACSVWEAVYILDGLLKNKSDIQPDTLHADTQGQSTPVFGLAYLLGIKLMPRIRNWQDLILYRPERHIAYRHIDGLLGEAINWDLILTHWQDMMQVALSIHVGKVYPSTLLRKLGHYSHKNRLYQAFRELGRVIRTVFLLRYISEPTLRRQITAETNKTEAYHHFAGWFSFGAQGIVSSKAVLEHEKRLKYNELIANAVMLQNVVDMTRLLRKLAQEGHIVTSETVATLSPYLTSHLKRIGEYFLDMESPSEELGPDAYRL